MESATSKLNTERGNDMFSYRVVPLRPLKELQKEALEINPPKEEGKLEPDLVELTKLDSSLEIDIRYSTTRNVMRYQFYAEPRAFMQRPAAEALVRAQMSVRVVGLKLVILDAYRPWYVTWMLYEATPDRQKRFVGIPVYGSCHNRGCAVDLTLRDVKTGELLHMPSGYDEFTERAHADYDGGTDEERANRDYLRRVMEEHGFAVHGYEWWHFDFVGYENHPIMNMRFEDI
jgi:zinc D-Ala-D-Ala dipeptidase